MPRRLDIEVIAGMLRGRRIPCDRLRDALQITAEIIDGRTDDIDALELWEETARRLGLIDKANKLAGLAALARVQANL